MSLRTQLSRCRFRAVEARRVADGHQGRLAGVPRRARWDAPARRHRRARRHHQGGHGAVAGRGPLALGVAPARCLLRRAGRVQAARRHAAAPGASPSVRQSFWESFTVVAYRFGSDKLNRLIDRHEPLILDQFRRRPNERGARIHPLTTGDLEPRLERIKSWLTPAQPRPAQPPPARLPADAHATAPQRPGERSCLHTSHPRLAHRQRRPTPPRPPLGGRAVRNRIAPKPARPALSVMGVDHERRVPLDADVAPVALQVELRPVPGEHVEGAVVHFAGGVDSGPTGHPL